MVNIGGKTKPKNMININIGITCHRNKMNSKLEFKDKPNILFQFKVVSSITEQSDNIIGKDLLVVMMGSLNEMYVHYRKAITQKTVQYI